ncbi:MAG: ABC transporter permease, partial [Spirochaetia bacterium]
MMVKTRGSFLLQLAFKNLTRYKRRTAITATAIGFGVAIFVAMASMLDGFEAESNRNLARYELGSAAVAHPEYWDDREQYPLDLVVEDADAVLEAFDRAGITAAPRLAFQGELVVHYDPFPEDGSLHLAFYGIDPVRDPMVFDLADGVVEGEFLGENEYGLLIGRWLADRLGAEIGFPVTVLARTRDGFRQIIDLEIAGIFEIPNPVVDRGAAFLPISTAERYLEMRGAVTTVHLALGESVPGTADLELARHALSQAPVAEDQPLAAQGQQPVVLSFADMTRKFAEAMEMEKAGNNVVLFLLAVIAVVGISNTMLMSVLEREREVGMMRAVGVRNAEIRKVFMYEAAGIGLLGSLVGITLSIGLVAFMVHVGIDYSAMIEDIEMGYRTGTVLYGVWNPATMAVATAFAVVVAGVTSFLPTRRILRRPVAAMSITLLFALVEGIKEDVRHNAWNYESGEVRLRNSQFDRYEYLNPVHYVLPNYEAVLQELESMPEVAALSPRINVNCAAFRGERRIFARGIAVDLEREG